MIDPIAFSAHPPRVLIVDDEDTICHILSLVAGRAGAVADTARDGKTARELLARHDYACALFDKNLPDLSGLDLLREVREKAPRTEVLLITGYANTESVIEALRLGAMDYVVKPFDIAAVAHRIQIALDRRRMRDELDAAQAALRVAHATLAESRQEVKRAYLETVLRLSLTTEYDDQGAPGHVRRISRYAGILARAVDATEEWVEQVMYAAPLHDIGNVGVSDDILRKPGPLTTNERAAMTHHVDIGARILEGSTSDVLALAREIILSHHERWDGRGYPFGLVADQIPLAGRIVALCDTFDAMTTDRCYRKARPVDAALEELQAQAGRQLDDTLVTAFLDCLPQVRSTLEESLADSQARRTSSEG